METSIIPTNEGLNIVKMSVLQGGLNMVSIEISAVFLFLGKNS